MKKLFSNLYSGFYDAKFIAHSRSLSKFKALQNNISLSSSQLALPRKKLEPTFVFVCSATFTTFKGQSYAITVENLRNQSIKHRFIKHNVQ